MIKFHEEKLEFSCQFADSHFLKNILLLISILHKYNQILTNHYKYFFTLNIQLINTNIQVIDIFS